MTSTGAVASCRAAFQLRPHARKSTSTYGQVRHQRATPCSPRPVVCSPGPLPASCRSTQDTLILSLLGHLFSRPRPTPSSAVIFGLFHISPPCRCAALRRTKTRGDFQHVFRVATGGPDWAVLASLLQNAPMKGGSRSFARLQWCEMHRWVGDRAVLGDFSAAKCINGREIWLI
jgi:hypothetical protein